MTTTPKAEITTIHLGPLSFEGLLIPPGTYAIAIRQLADLNLVPPNRSLKQLETLLGIGLQSHLKAKTALNPKAVNVLSLEDFTRVLVASANKGNENASVLRDALVGLSLTQVFSDAFGIKFEADERRQFLMTRLAGKVTRRQLTDAIKDYLETHDVSESYRKFVYSNCSDRLNRAVFGKNAAELVETRGYPKDKLRDTHTRDELALIDRVEGHAVALIDRGLDPYVATKDAIDFYQPKLPVFATATP